MAIEALFGALYGILRAAVSQFWAPRRRTPVGSVAYCVFGKSSAGFAAKKLKGRIWKWCHIVGITGESSTRGVWKPSVYQPKRSAFSIGRTAIGGGKKCLFVIVRWRHTIFD